PGEPTLVVGAGPIGLGVAQFAQLAGADVAVLEISAQRRAFCETHLPGVRVAAPGAAPADTARDLFQGELPTAGFDATGNAQSMVAAFGLGANGGRLTFVGLVQSALTFHDPEFHRREMTLLSSRNATSEDFAAVIAALESGQVNLAPWITHHATPAT